MGEGSSACSLLSYSSGSCNIGKWAFVQTWKNQQSWEKKIAWAWRVHEDCKLCWQCISWKKKLKSHKLSQTLESQTTLYTRSVYKSAVWKWNNFFTVYLKYALQKLKSCFIKSHDLHDRGNIEAQAMCSSIYDFQIVWALVLLAKASTL